MADTGAYREAEKWVREEGLPGKFKTPFSKQFLELGERKDGTRARHEFDAVSADGRIVTSIKASSGLTGGNRNPSGKIKDSFAEVLFLSQVKAPSKYLVLTDPEFFRIFQRESDGKIPRDVEILHIPLRPDVQDLVNRARREASAEVTPQPRPSRRA